MGNSLDIVHSLLHIQQQWIMSAHEGRACHNVAFNLVINEKQS